MWRLEMYDVMIQVIPRWMKRSLHMLKDDREYPRLNSGEFIIIGTETNEDLLRAAGFFACGATFDYAVPLGDPLYGPNAFTFYAHPGKEWADVREGTAVRYSSVEQEVKARVAEHLKYVVSQHVVADVVGGNEVYLIVPGQEVYDDED